MEVPLLAGAAAGAFFCCCTFAAGPPFFFLPPPLPPFLAASHSSAPRRGVDGRSRGCRGCKADRRPTSDVRLLQETSVAHDGWWALDVASNDGRHSNMLDMQILVWYFEQLPSAQAGIEDRLTIERRPFAISAGVCVGSLVPRSKWETRTFSGQTRIPVSGRLPGLLSSDPLRNCSY